LGQGAQVKDRDDVKELLQQLLQKFKCEINKELEEKNRYAEGQGWQTTLQLRVINAKNVLKRPKPACSVVGTARRGIWNWRHCLCGSFWL
jgi:hypothetical protein